MMSEEFEFNEMHKDSFVRAKKPGEEKAKAKPPKKAPPAPEQTEGVDDFVPEKVGQVVDNVFGKLDNLVNDAADYLFGNKGKTMPKNAPPKEQARAIPPLKQAPDTPPNIPEIKYKPEPKETAKKSTPATKPIVKAPPKPAHKPEIKQISTLQSGMRQPQMITPVMPESKSKIKGPVISRTTSLSELDIPLEYLDDPDLPRYFDQMKLYETQAVSGGLCNMSQFEAEAILKKGHWKSKFSIQFEDLKRIDPGIHPLEMAKSRFMGMRPVYKAMAPHYSSKEALIKAIEDDITAYLHGKQNPAFHRFIYQVVSTRY